MKFICIKCCNVYFVDNNIKSSWALNTVTDYFLWDRQIWSVLISTLTQSLFVCKFCEVLSVTKLEQFWNILLICLATILCYDIIIINASTLDAAFLLTLWTSEMLVHVVFLFFIIVIIIGSISKPSGMMRVDMKNIKENRTRKISVINGLAVCCERAVEWDCVSPFVASLTGAESGRQTSP